MAKNFEDISCIFCGNKNNIKDACCNSCQKPLHIGEEFVEKTINNYTLKQYKARGYYGLTFKAFDNYGKDFAIKLISKKSYLNQKKDFHREAEIYAKLPRSTIIVNYIGAGETTLLYKSNPVEFYYIVCEWVNGETFRDFVSNQKLIPEDLISATRDLLFGLQELQDKNIWHNDLHDENVIVDT